MAEIIMIHDLIADRETGETYRELNAKKRHNIPIGELVELENGARLFVVCHRRDCDMTPLYSLAVDKDKNDSIIWHNGYPESSLKIFSRGDK